MSFGSMNLGGAGSGAISGASLGSMFGPWGTAIGGIGGGLLGLFSGGSNSGGGQSWQTRMAQGSQASMLDRLYNNMRLFDDTTGGIAHFAQAQPNLYTLGPEEQAAMRNIIDFGKTGGSLSFADWQRSMEQQLNDQAQQDAAKKYYESIVAPQVANQAALSGYGGRSGAALELSNRAGTQMALPIAQQNQQNRFAYGMAEPGTANLLDTLRMSMYGAAGQAAGAQRNLSMQDFLRQQSIMSQLLGLMGGQNLTPSNVSGSTPNTTLQNLGGIAALYALKRGGGSTSTNNPGYDPTTGLAPR